MDYFSNLKESLHYVKSEAEIQQDKSESKTTVGSLNQIISQNNSQFLNKENNQVKDLIPQFTPQLTNYTNQDASQMQSIQISPSIQMTTPMDYQSYQMNLVPFPQQPLQVPSQFMNPIQNHSQQLQPQQMMFGNNNQIFLLPNFPMMQSQQSNPIYSYNMLYNPLNLQNMQQMGAVPTLSTFQQRDQSIIPSSDNQNSLESIQKSVQEKQKKQTINLQNQQLNEVQLNQTIKINGVFKQDIQSNLQQQENESVSLQENLKLSNQQVYQTKLPQNRININQNIQELNEKIIQTHQSLQRSNQITNQQKWKSSKQIEEEETSNESNLINNNNLNNQPSNNSQYQNSNYQKDTFKQYERKMQQTGDYLNSYQKLNQKNVINCKIDHLEKYQSNICSFRKIKSNDPQIKVIYSISPDPVQQSIQDEVSLNQSSSEIQNQQQQNIQSNCFKTSKIFKEQLKNKINEKNEGFLNEKRVIISPSEKLSFLKKRKHHEIPNAEIQNSLLISTSEQYEISKNKQDPYINLNYSNEQTCSQDLKIQVSNSNIRKYIKIMENDQQLITLNQQGSQNKKSLLKFDQSPNTNYLSINKNKTIQKLEKDRLFQKGVISQNSQTVEFQKYPSDEYFKEDMGDYFPELENDQEWEDSFFKEMRTHTKSGGKSFFLVYNYKKKLIQQLDPEDQAILKQMKQSKKFNFSKNVIKQFLKVMNSQLNYVYKFARNYNSHIKVTENNQSIQQNRNEITDSKKSNIITEYQSVLNNQPDFSKKDRHFIDQSNPSSILPQNQQYIQNNSQQDESINLKNQVINLSNNKIYTKVKNPSRYQLNYLRSNIKEFLTFNSYTHSSIKKIIAHDYYSLYFRDFLEIYCNEWIEQGKTKYKNEQKIMIQFLLLCLRNRKLLIFLSQHDPQNDIPK